MMEDKMQEISNEIMKWYEEHKWDQIWTGSDGYNLCFNEPSFIKIASDYLNNQE